MKKSKKETTPKEDFLDEIIAERTSKNPEFPQLVNAKGKPYAEEAHEFLKVLGKWVELKKTFPSGYVDYHEATRKFLENFKNK